MYLIALLAVAAATVVDLRRREIPNWISAGLLVVALVASVWGAVPPHCSERLLGLALASALTLPLFARGEERVLEKGSALLAVEQSLNHWRCPVGLPEKKAVRAQEERRHRTNAAVAWVVPAPSFFSRDSGSGSSSRGATASRQS